jgi:hypothetical protein
MRNPDAASFLLFRPINLLKRDFEWKNSDIAKHLPLLLNPSLSELANIRLLRKPLQPLFAEACRT